MSLEKILVISPHFDDAALSACDYILSKKRKNTKIVLLNIFTQFAPTFPSYSQNYINKSGFDTIARFSKQRKIEDSKAMRLLGLTSFDLNMIDGGFRSYKGTFSYPTATALFSGTLHPLDKSLLQRLEKLFLKVDPLFDKVLVPLGIGNHTDHVLVNIAAKKSFDFKKIEYYLDYPYALERKNFFSIVKLLLQMRLKSCHFTSHQKRDILNCYSSQIDILLSKNYLYPELIFTEYGTNYKKTHSN